MEEKKEELEGFRGTVTEDRVSKRVKKHLFLGILLWMGSKRLQAFVWHVAETTQIPACCLGGICRERQECWSFWNAASRGPAWSSDKLLLAAGHDQRNSSGSGIDPHSSLQDSWDKCSSDKCMETIILWGQRLTCYLWEHIDESHAHLLLQFLAGGKRVWQMVWNVFQTLGNTLKQLPLNILTLTISDQEPCLAPVGLHIWALSWEVNVNTEFILCMGSWQIFVTSRHRFTAVQVNEYRKRWKNSLLSDMKGYQAS